MTENTFIYPANRTTDGCTNLLLIDQAVRDTQVFVSSANATTYPLIYSPQSTKTELHTFLQNNFPTIDRIGLVFETSGGGGGGSFRPFFLDGQPFFNQADITHLAENIQNAYSENVTFLINLLKDFHVANIDYLACNTLNYPEWVNYYAILTQETNNSVVIGASNDETGNIKYGGDWVMENTSENIELIYFNESIAYYTYLLGSLSSHTIVIKNDGELYGCGRNSSGQLGLGYTTPSDTSPFGILTLTLIPVIAGKTPVAVSCGESHTIVLMSDGTLYGCGKNYYGQLGLGAGAGNGNQPTLTEITLIKETLNGQEVSISSKTPVAVSCGQNYTVVLMSNGELYGCGYNTYGQLGLDAGAGSQPSLTKMIEIAGKIPVAVSCGASHTLVLMSDGEIYGCGYNKNKQLGLGASTANQPTLTLIPGIAEKIPVAVSGGKFHTVVLMSDGEIYGCGYNFYEQLGLGGGGVVDQPSLTQMIEIEHKTPVAVSCGIDHTLVLMCDGELYGCGRNNQGQLGLGADAGTDNQPTLTQIPGIAGKTPVAMSGSGLDTIVLMNDGTLYGCGRNNYGSLGLNDRTQRTTLTEIPITNISAVMDMVGEEPPAPISNICFPAGTPVKTDQGIIEIQNIKPDHHTIGLKPIKAITQTLSEDPDLICFEKDALYADVPSEKTVMTLNHGVLFKGKWYKAQDMIGVVGEKCSSKKIYRIPYKKGTILYNVLLETHSHMLINNLIVETLNPLNEMVPLYNYFNTMKPSFLLQKACINIFNRSVRQTRQKSLMAN